MTRHLHAAVKEIEPTHEEWFTAISFLTNTGQMCTDGARNISCYRMYSASRCWWTPSTTAVPKVPRRTPSLGRSMLTTLHVIRTAQTFAWIVRANLPWSEVVCSISKAGPLLGPPWISGRRTMMVSTTCSRRACSRNTISAGSSQPMRTVVMVPYGQTTALPDPGRWPCRQAAWQSGSPSEPRGPPALHRHGSGLRPGHHPIFTPDCPYLKEDTVFGVKKELIATIQTVNDPDLAPRMTCRAPSWWSTGTSFWPGPREPPRQ